MISLMLCIWTKWLDCRLWKDKPLIILLKNLLIRLVFMSLTMLLPLLWLFLITKLISCCKSFVLSILETMFLMVLRSHAYWLYVKIFYRLDLDSWYFIIWLFMLMPLPLLIHIWIPISLILDEVKILVLQI